MKPKNTAVYSHNPYTNTNTNKYKYHTLNTPMHTQARDIINEYRSITSSA